MSDHEYWMGGEDKTAQWPTPAPNGQGSSEAESTDPLGVASTQEGAPTWPLPAGATASSAGPADAGAPQEISPLVERLCLASRLMRDFMG